MRLNDVSALLNKNIDNVNKDMFIKGSIIKGRLVEKVDNQIFIQLSNKEIIKAETKIPLKAEAGDNLEFIVKDMKDGILFLTPKVEKSSEKSNLNFINKVIEKYNLPKSEQNIELIKGLISLDMNVTKDTIFNVIKNISTLELLYKKLGNDNTLNKTNLISNNNLSDKPIDKLINYDTKDIGSESKLIKNLFHNNIENMELPNLKDNTLKSLLFLVKNDMKINLENLKFTMNIMEGKDFLSSNIRAIESYIETDPKFHDIRGKLQNLMNFKDNISTKNLGKQSIENYHAKLSEIVEEINKYTTDKDKGNIKSILDSTNKEIDYLKDINKNMTFLYYPINLKNEEILDKIYMFNKNKNKNKFNKNKFKIYFSLNTMNLDKIDIMYEIFQDKNIVNFKLKDKESADYIEKNKKILEKHLINSKIKNHSIIINVVKEDQGFNPLDDIDLDNYVFDARV